MLVTKTRQAPQDPSPPQQPEQQAPLQQMEVVRLFPLQIERFFVPSATHCRASLLVWQVGQSETHVPAAQNPVPLQTAEHVPVPRQVRHVPQLPPAHAHLPSA